MTIVSLSLSLSLGTGFLPRAPSSTAAVCLRRSSATMTSTL
jgi:hypothetical protein